jgi:hypothetical protein
MESTEEDSSAGAPTSECYIRSIADAQDADARAGALRQACRALDEAPSSVHAIGVTGHLIMSSGAAQPLLLLSERLGAEFGLRSRLHIGHRSFTVTFSRVTPIRPQEPR